MAGIEEEMANSLCGLLGMKKKVVPVRYLRVPLISTRLRARDCEDIKNRLLRKVQCWTAKALSYAGRIQLAISVLHSIRSYWETIFILPILC